MFKVSLRLIFKGIYLLRCREKISLFCDFFLLHPRKTIRKLFSEFIMRCAYKTGWQWMKMIMYCSPNQNVPKLATYVAEQSQKMEKNEIVNAMKKCNFFFSFCFGWLERRIVTQWFAFVIECLKLYQFAKFRILNIEIF